MGLFNKKKEETNSCCCVGNCTPKTMAKTEASKSGVGVKVLGSGCVKCKTLENATREALVELGMDTTIDHVTDFSQIAAYGVMTTPALWTGKSCLMARCYQRKKLKPSLRMQGGNAVLFYPSPWLFKKATLQGG